MSTHLLLNEKPLMVLPSLAKLIGINGSIAVQQIHWFVEIKEEHSDNRTLYNGFLWCKYSLKQWQDKLQWMSVDGISRMFTRLESQNIIISCQPDSNRRDQTKWYRVNYEGLESFERPSKSLAKGTIEQFRDRPQVEMRDRPQVEMRDRPQVEMRDRPQVEMINIKEINKETNKEINKETQSRDLFDSESVLISDSDLPANQVLIDCMADQRETPIPPTPFSPSPESFGLAIAENTKPQKAKKQQCDLNLFLQVWNQDAPRHWVRHTTIDSATARKLIKFANEFENSLEMFQKGLWFAQTDTQWCMKPTTKLKMTNVLSRDTNLIFQFYESYEDNQRRSQQSPLDRPMTPVENKMAHTYSMILEAIA